MNLITRTQSKNYLAFARYLATQPAHKYGCAELNHAETMKMRLPHGSGVPRFVNSIPSFDDLTTEWSKLMKYKLERGRVVHTQGVRASLFGLFKSTKFPLILPSDVYPVYQSLATQAGCTFTEYATINQTIRLPSQDGILLITDPTPFGARITSKQLLSWLSESPDRRVIVDAVYACNARRDMSVLLNTEKVFYCHSLSKYHAIPWQFGITLTPKTMEKIEFMNFVDPPTEDGSKKAMEMMMDFPHMGKEQIRLYREGWRRLFPVLHSVDASWEKGPDTYLSVSHVSPERLLEHGILAIPPNVYESPQEDLSILSVLKFLPEKVFSRTMYHVTRIENFSRAYNKYSGRYEKKKISGLTFPDQFHLLHHDELDIGVEKHRSKGIADDGLIVLRTRTSLPLFPSESGVAQYINDGAILIDGVGQLNGADKNDIVWETVEEMYCKSLHRRKKSEFPSFGALTPRSVSLLPVAQGCQAKCPFCFSHSSVSDDIKQARLGPDRISEVLATAKHAGATRAVITGGGEPTMVPSERLLPMVERCAEHFSNVVMITNGYVFGKLADEHRLEYLLKMQASGLTVLSMSRHGAVNADNTKIMHLDTKSERVADTFKGNSTLFDRLKLRWVCVLQQGGVDSSEKIAEYLDWVVSTGVTEICFKELYISTSIESVYHQYESNRWSREHQVPLFLLTSFLESNGGIIVDKLPWGAPIYELDWNSGGERGATKHATLRIAAYTEPSLTWELEHGIARSWNLMADGDCYVSLEDQQSKIQLSTADADGGGRSDGTVYVGS